MSSFAHTQISATLTEPRCTDPNTWIRYLEVCGTWSLAMIGAGDFWKFSIDLKNQQDENLWKNTSEHQPPCSRFNIRQTWFPLTWRLINKSGQWFVIFPVCLCSQTQLDLTDRNHKTNHLPGCSDRRLTTTLLRRSWQNKNNADTKAPSKTRATHPWDWIPLCHRIFWRDKDNHCSSEICNISIIARQRPFCGDDEVSPSLCVSWASLPETKEQHDRFVCPRKAKIT